MRLLENKNADPRLCFDLDDHSLRLAYSSSTVVSSVQYKKQRSEEFSDQILQKSSYNIENYVILGKNTCRDITPT